MVIGIFDSSNIPADQQNRQTETAPASLTQDKGL